MELFWVHELDERKRWDSFLGCNRNVIDDGFRIGYWQDLWNGDTILIEIYSSLFLIAKDRDTMVADYLENSNGCFHRNL